MMNINQFLNIFVAVLLYYTIYNTIYIWYLLLTRKYYNKEEDYNDDIDYNDNIQLESYKRSLTKENLKVINSMNGRATLLYNLFFL